MQLFTDCESLVKATQSLLSKQKDKVTKQDVAMLKHEIGENRLKELIHVSGPTNASDALSKRPEKTAKTMFELLRITLTGVFTVYAHTAKAPDFDTDYEAYLTLRKSELSKRRYDAYMAHRQGQDKTRGGSCSAVSGDPTH